MDDNRYTGFEIAVVGMQCRFPGASNVDQFWENLKNGVDSVSTFSDDELREYGISENDVLNPSYVKAKGLIKDAHFFDASFFGFSPNEANVLDPQIRILSQCAYHALEDAGYNFEKEKNKVGVFVGAIPNINWQLHSFNKAGGQYSEQFSSLILNDKDFASTRLSYLLNLHGPSSTVYTACSTSLVSVDMACQSLLTGKCDLSLAGGVALSLPYKSGYLYESGMIMSKDGRTCSFDANATGTVWGDGVGVVVLKRLEDAINDRDNIHAVIKGSGINNDGNRKVGYTAPSVKGQVEVINDALAMAEVAPESISYIEGHGSATSLGDKIEISALKEVFGNVNEGYKCPIGSVKSNVGHLNTAAGIAGLIKVCLMLKNSQIPPSINYTSPNSILQDPKCPFFVNNSLTKWEQSNFPLRAGVSSFGIGGTNAHLILEKAPDPENQSFDKRQSLVCLSSKTSEGLNILSETLSSFIKKNVEVDISNIAYTLQTGRDHFPIRRSIVFEDIDKLVKELSREGTYEQILEAPKVVMMFPGMGTIYSNLGKDLYLKERTFREAMDDCFRILNAKTGRDFKAILYPENGSQFPQDFQVPQLLVFSFEYALSVLLKSWGITADYVIGYSLGEYVAACVSGVFDLETALDILVERGRLINTLDNGGMIAVPLSKEAIQTYLEKEVYIAIDNGQSVVVAGSQESLKELKAKLEQNSITTIEINDSYALHSPQMDPIIEEFEQLISKYEFKVPGIPMMSNITGVRCNENITSSGYWSEHLSRTINFSKGLDTILNESSNTIFLEVGAGNSLSVLARRTSDKKHQLKLVSLAKKAKTKTLDHTYLLKAIGNFWQYGGKVNWKAYHSDQYKNKLSLPTYPFEKKSFSLQLESGLSSHSNTQDLSKNKDISSWFYIPSWKRLPLLADDTKKAKAKTKNILILGWKEKKSVKTLLKNDLDTIITATYSDHFKKVNKNKYHLNYDHKEDIVNLFESIDKQGIVLDKIIDITGLTAKDHNDIKNLERTVNLFQAISLSASSQSKIDYLVVSSELFSIYGNEKLNPWKSTILSAIKVIPQEIPNVSCRLIEVEREVYKTEKEKFYKLILDEQRSVSKDKIISYRGASRWVQTVEHYPIHVNKQTDSFVKKNGVYIIVGGLGDIGRSIAKYLLQNFDANVILIGRSQLPDRSQWQQWQKEHSTDEVISKKIAKIIELESYGGTVTAVQADSTSYAEMTQTFLKVKSKFGTVNGIFHSAGIITPESFNIVKSINRKQLECHFPVKSEGLAVISRIVEKDPLDFVSVISSLSSFLGGLGMIGYAAANQFMDTMVANENSKGNSTRWITLNYSNWEGWEDEFKGLSLTDDILNTFITLDEGEKTFNNLLAKSNDQGQVIISPVHLPSLIDKWDAYDNENSEKGKISKSKQNSKPFLSNEYLEPSTDLEKKLVQIWEEIFGFGPIGILDDFMELGGDSLKAITMLSHVQGKTAMTMSLQDFFSNTTIQKLCEKVTETHFVSISKIDKKEFYPVTASQHRTWVLSQLEAGSAAYNLTKVIELKGDLDKAKFQKTFELLISRHEILRTYFKTNDSGEICQFIIDKNEVNFEVKYLDFSKKLQKDLDQYLINEQALTFDLSKTPLFRATLLETKPNEYVFSFVMHHIISDGWSMELLISEIVTTYNHLVKGEDIEYKELSIQYKDYTVWLQEQKSTEEYKKAEQYWVSKFQGDIPVLDLPSFKKRPSVWSYNGSTIHKRYSRTFLSKLKRFSKDHDVTMFMTLMAGVNALLYRYTNQNDIILGTPVAGREHADIQDQIGLYLNTLAIRTTVDVNYNFIDFLDHQKKVLLEAYDHQNYSFDDLIGKLNVKRDTSRSVLFDVLVVLQNQAQLKTIQSNTNIEGVQITPYEIENKTAKFDLTFFFVETDTLELDIQYNKDIYDEFLITRIFTHFQNFIENSINSPQEKLCSVAYLEKKETNELLEKFGNRVTIDYPKDKTIIDLFEEQVKKTPDNLALVFEGTKLTYKQLNEKANRLAFHLSKKYDIKPHDLVGILLERSEWMIISMLAVLKNSGAYVPIDPQYPQRRIDYIKEDSSCKLIIDQEKLDWFYLDSDSNPGKNMGNHTLPNNLIYVIYTSGSTGDPKGVMITHENVTDYTIGLFNHTPIKTCRSFALMSNIATDLGNTVIYGALLSGGALYLPKKETLRNTESMYEYFEAHSIDCIKIVPAHWKALTRSDSLLLPNKMIIFGGESLPVSYVNMIKEQSSKITVINHYGPTETTIGKLLYTIESSIENANIPIGRPFSQTSAYVVDKTHNLCPIGVIGELLIGGKGVAKGYYNKPELTKKQFIQNPFMSKTDKLYKTGDLVRMLPDGNIEFIGRKDGQVKIRGYRIELDEIERHFSMIEGVKQSVVIVKEKEDEEKYLVAYYVSDEILDKSDLQSRLSKMLPDYMVPGYYVQMDVIPLTNNGKVDKKMLPETQEKDLIKAKYIAPVTQEERFLSSIWSEVLKYENIGVKDNFYHLGGDSIKAILVISLLNQEGYRLKVEQLLKNPILEDLAQLIETNTITVDQSEVEGKVELTPIQRYFFENDLIANKNYYNQSISLCSASELDSDILEKCISFLVKHHDALRMVYHYDNGTYKQYNADTNNPHYKISFYDLRKESDELAAMNEIGAQLQSSFDIGSGVLLHIGHFRLADGDQLVFIIHHLVIDGVSWRILLEDLSKLYESYTLGVSVALPLKTNSYQQWGALQKEYAQSKKMKNERKYWEAISQVSIPDFPVDHHVTESAWNINSACEFTLDKETTEKLKTKVHHVYNTEINDVLLTALGLALREVLEVDKTEVLMEGHGREEISDQIDVGRTVGWFTCLFPFVLDMTNTSVSELIHVKESLRKVPNKGIGYGISHYLDKRFDKESSPSIKFNYLGDFSTTTKKDDKNSLFTLSEQRIGSDIDIANTQSQHYLDVLGKMVKDRLSVSIRYSDVWYTKETINELSTSYQTHLKELVEMLSKKDATELTPSDLTYKELSYHAFSEINKDNHVEDIYELSPLQQGLYYHWLMDTSSPTYFEQFSYSFKTQNLNFELVEESFNRLIDRYTILRTSFDDTLGEIPLQIVHKKVEGDFSRQEVSLDDIDRIKDEDRQRGFDLSTPSLMRLKVLQVSADECVFIWSFHHILMDGWCISILVNDFYRIWMDMSNNKSVNLPKPIPYSSYIQWLSTVDKHLSLSYWKNYLSGLDTVTEIPFKKPKARRSNNLKVFKTEELLCQGSDFKNTDHFAKDLGITLNTFVQGVWGYLLSQYNNTNDVIFGSVVSGRPADLSGVEEMVGLFINTIPVRVKLQKEDTPTTFLNRLHEEVLESMPHHYVDLSDVQSQSPLGMDLIKNLVVFENYLAQDDIQGEMEHLYASEQGQTLSMQELSIFEQTNYDFNITVFPDESSLRIEFQYNAEVFESEMIKDLVSHFRNLLEKFSSQRNATLDSMGYLTPQEEHILLHDFNTTTVDYPKDKTLIDLFEKQAEETPNNIALVFEQIELTYKELNEQANRLAHYINKGYTVKPDDLVGVQLERGEWMIISIIAVLKSGAAYVPIDPGYPKERIDYIKKDSNCKVVIDQSLLDQFYLESDTCSTKNVDYDILPDSLAYVIYTSGSTGKPKGVMIEHSNFLHQIQWYISNYDISEKTNSLLLTSFTFDPSIQDIFGTLTVGGKLHLISQEHITDIEYVRSFIKEKQITLLNYVPQYLDKLLSENSKIESLDIVILGGEALSEKIKKSILDKGYVLYNNYGPTEITVDALSGRMDNGLVHIGKPISNTKAYILNQEFELMPIGVPGGLYISGDGVARGYLNRPELTSEKFITNPFVPGERMYDTGDLCKWLPDGNIEFLGRIDRQVKIRGFRVELPEIEQCLLDFPGIKEVVVHPFTEKDGNKQLIAYLIGDEKLEEDKVKLFLQKNLPSYMIPSGFMQIKEIPLTPNKKTDVNALPAPAVGKDKVIIPPSNPEQMILREICSDVLEIDKEDISVGDNFFDLGGHSIKAMLLISRIQKKLGVKISLSDIFNNPVLLDLSDLLKKAKANPVNAIQKSVNKPFYKTSSIQRRLYYLQSLNPNQISYNMPVGYQIKGKIDKRIFEEAFNHLMDRHEILRTYFDVQDNEIIQKIMAKLDFNFDYVVSDGSTYDGYITNFLRPFDLNKGPLFRVRLIEFGPENYFLLLDFHHIISDAFSINTLINDFVSLYRGNTLKKLKFQYRDYAEWQHSQTFLDISNRQQNYWKKKLVEAENISYIQLPLSGEGTGSEEYNFTMDEEKTMKVNRYIQQHAVTLNMFLQTVFNILLSKISYQETIILGTPMTGRRSEELENIAGMFVNTVVLVNYPKKEKAFQEFLLEVKKTAIEAFEHQEYPFDELVEMLGRNRSNDRNPVFNVMFEFQNIDLSDLIMPGLTITPYPVEKNASKFDLTIVVQEIDNQIKLQYKYSQKYFSNESIIVFNNNFQHLIDQILDQINPKLEELTIANQQESDDLLMQLSQPINE
ncbi:hybrid non-ribosomal peptide synthetase/type I polyketide synthase [Aquimarina sediminis]|uniref:hybrid non-ribosomal peptide synthetase/type I polyketide synthase n=1 Tax=Aquimarina sediminis TaxID=2070536 RepID=UPI000CA02574|nr:hybrid non-ribosomal peptide synthetase/type I polyketide synthase [Aquimarina sediminis]